MEELKEVVRSLVPSKNHPIVQFYFRNFWICNLIVALFIFSQYLSHKDYIEKSFVSFFSTSSVERLEEILQKEELTEDDWEFLDQLLDEELSEEEIFLLRAIRDKFTLSLGMARMALARIDKKSNFVITPIYIRLSVISKLFYLLRNPSRALLRADNLTLTPLKELLKNARVVSIEEFSKLEKIDFDGRLEEIIMSLQDLLARLFQIPEADALKELFALKEQAILSSKKVSWGNESLHKTGKKIETFLGRINKSDTRSWASHEERVENQKVLDCIASLLGQVQKAYNDLENLSESDLDDLEKKLSDLEEYDKYLKDRNRKTGNEPILREEINNILQSFGIRKGTTRYMALGNPVRFFCKKKQKIYYCSSISFELYVWGLS